MDILAQRKSVGTLTGQLLVGGRPVTRGFIRKTAYVPQDDNFVPTMTTMETMRFYSAIILPDSIGRSGRQQRVEEVLGAVGLGTHHKTLVGGVLPGGLMLRGLSGGERKRLSIAAGILAAPSVVYLDGGGREGGAFGCVLASRLCSGAPFGACPKAGAGFGGSRRERRAACLGGNGSAAVQAPSPWGMPPHRLPSSLLPVVF
jgi:ATP-binding cassette subfamily G (WHITE) protein 2